MWLAPAAALGWGRLEGRFAGAPLFGLGAALLLVAPSLWGFGGQVDPIDRPPEWAEARHLVDRDPGPVLALPFTQYVRPDVVDGHLVHQPLPFVLGGDVLYASGRGAEGGPVERADDRLDTAGVIVDRLRNGVDPTSELEVLGIRWIAVLAGVDSSYDDLDRIGGSEPILERRRGGPDPHALPRAVRTARRRGGRGPGGRPRPHPRAPGHRRERPELPVVPSRIRRVAAGWAAGHPGRLREPRAVPAGSGLLWYWPSVLVLLADGITLGGLILACRRHR